MAVIHLVLFQFKAMAGVEGVDEACRKMLALKDTCLRPGTQKPYILSLTGGKDHSPEGAQNGITHAFTVEFESVADRDYYVNIDPVHQVFKGFAGGVLEKAIVVDYTAGEF